MAGKWRIYGHMERQASAVSSLCIQTVDSGRKECPLRYGGAGFRFGRRETPEIFGCDYLAVEMDDGDISFPFISMR